MNYVAGFDEQAAADAARAGGKGRELARMAAAGFRVPPGFCVLTDAYRAHASVAGVGTLIGKLPADPSPGQLEAATTRISDAIHGAHTPPGVREELERAYARLGEGEYVAVRSSGTAEDLSDASFAGLHDTYLDVRGPEELVEAVRHCWASMWNPRAAAYRNSQGIDHDGIELAVVVQRMVAAEAAGVMFTANPLNTATDEIVVNANWGLGESVVSGRVTPDEFVVRADTLDIITRTTGSKEFQVVRSPDGGRGTVEAANSRAASAEQSLTEGQVRHLAELGIRLQEWYGMRPLDVEWAIESGQAHILQARPITGVEFSWDADVDAWQTRREDPDTVWTREMSDEGWTGAKTPLMYAWRAESWTRSMAVAGQLWDIPEMSEMRIWKFHKGEAYYNTAMERAIVEKTLPPALRPAELPRIPRQQQAKMDTDFSITRYLKVYARTQLLGDRLGPLQWHKLIDEYIDRGDSVVPDIADERLRQLSDRALRDHIAAVTEMERRYCDDIWIPFFLYARDSFSMLTALVGKFYRGANPALLADILTGASQQTITQQENHALWALAQRIRSSTALLQQFRDRPGAAFFAELGDTQEDQDFRSEYEDFLSWSGHRGHSDRDFIFARRIEDPSLDYRSLESLVSMEDTTDPAEREAAVRHRRQAAIDELLANLRDQHLGTLKSEAARFLIDYVDRFLIVRDNERHFVDRSTFAAKRALQEVGARLHRRELLSDSSDFYFLTLAELCRLLDGSGDPELAAIKAAARRRDFDRVHSKDVTPAPYLHRGHGIDLDNQGEGGMTGTGTSRGSVSGTARVVKCLDEIGQVRSGEILVCNATDPGWTPVFNVIAGVVLETGGMLAHASCLAREYGLPAVQMPNAMRLIPDGSSVTIDGDTGQVTLEEQSGDRAA